jgi:heptosyltransferase-2
MHLRRRVTVPPGGYRRISVIRLSSLGDVVLTLPVVRALRRAYPEARLHYWVKEEYADVVRFDPAVSHVRVLERDARRLEDVVSMGAELEEEDLIVDLHGNPRARVLTFRQHGTVLRAPSYRLRRQLLVRARWLGIADPPRAVRRYARALAPLGLAAEDEPRLHCGADAEDWAEREADRFPAPPVALCPAAAHATKRWPEPCWLELFGVLRARGLPVVCFTRADERANLPQLARRVGADSGAGWCSERLARMAALLSRCRAAVTLDSGLMHVAAARGVRVVALFGGTDPRLGFAPVGEGHQVLCRREPCQPCALHGRPACPLGHHDCMRKLSAADVLGALGRLGATGP